MATARSERDAAAVDEVIKALDEPDRTQCLKLHEVIMAAAPDLLPRTWYGMPAYSNGNKVVLFVRPRSRFGERFITLGFNDVARLDDGDMWPTNFGIVTVTDEVADRVAALVKTAVAD